MDHTFHPEPLIATMITQSAPKGMIHIPHEQKGGFWQSARSRSGHKRSLIEKYFRKYATHVLWVVVYVEIDGDNQPTI